MDTWITNAQTTRNDQVELNKILIMEKFHKAEEFKSEGGSLFKTDPQKALRCYHRCLLYLKGIKEDMFPPLGIQASSFADPQIEKDINTMRAAVSNNIAACLLVKEPIQYDRVLSCTEVTLTEEPENVKAHYRRALALYGLNNYQEARISAMRASSLLNHKDMASRKLLASIDEKLKEEKQNFEVMFKNKLFV